MQHELQEEDEDERDKPLNQILWQRYEAQEVKELVHSVTKCVLM